jgi:hypothetical protein
MTRRARLVLLVVAVLGALVATSLVPAGVSLAGPGATSRAPAAARTAPTVPGGSAALPHGVAARPTGAANNTTLVCPVPPFGPVELNGAVFPVDPNLYFQNPCPPIQQDEVHASWGSTTAGSGERFTVPWYLPPEGGPGQEYATSGAYLSLVVKGDPASESNQSFLEVLANPIGAGATFSWSVEVAVLSFVNLTTYPNVAQQCLEGQEQSYNFSFYCEFDDLANENPLSLLTTPGGGWFNVTFDGNVNATSGLAIWMNQTTGGSANASVVLSSATTGTFAFEPYFLDSCPDSCYLRWGLSYGNGAGVNICPQVTSLVAICDSYNESTWVGLPPFEFGAPEFFTNGSYSGDYRVFAPESASGVCDTTPPLGVLVAQCYDYLTGGGTGFYPYFSLNGNLSASWLAFGTSYPAARTLFGTAAKQYPISTVANDLEPIAVTDVTDSSEYGYLGPGLPLNVSVRATDLGSTASVKLAYSVNGSAWTTVRLNRTAGSAADGVYAGAVPAGPNGTIEYFLNATGAAEDAASSGKLTVLREAIPSFAVSIGVIPASCGSVDVNGVVEPNGSVAHLHPGVYLVVATGCYSYAFSGWVTGNRVQVVSSGDPVTNASVAGPGLLEATWHYVRAPMRITVESSPANCGSVDVNGSAYPNGSLVILPYGLAVPIAANGCTSYRFAGWAVTGNLSVVGLELTPYNNGTLLARFLPSSAALTLSFATSPAACGGVGYLGAVYTNGESVAVDAGTYPIAPAPCAHWGFTNFTVQGGLAVKGFNLTVTTSGTVTENNYRLTEIRIATSPSWCGGVTLNGVNYANGDDIAVQNNSVYTVTGFSCAGHYLESLTSSGNLSLAGTFLTVTGSGELLVVSLTGAPQAYIGFLTTPPTCGSILLAGTTFANGGFTSVTPGAVEPIVPLACPNYGFVRFATTGGIAVENGTAYLNGSGSIEAYFGPLVDLIVDTIPADCGAVLFDGAAVTDGNSTALTEGVTYALTAVPCAHYALAEFETSPFVAIQNGSIAPTGPSTITAVFALIPYPVPVATTGAGCGAITVAGVGTPSGSVDHLTFGTYPVVALPCRTSLLVGWVTTGLVSVVGRTLYVNGSGNLTADFDFVPPSVTLAGPNATYVGALVPFYAVVKVPVGASGYLFNWTFGDGTTALSTSNATTHAFAAAGEYTVRVRVTDPEHRVANATLAVTVAGTSSASSSAAVANALLAVGAAAVVLVGVWVATARRRPPAPEAAPVVRAVPPP